MKVLLVDDEEDIRKIGARCLEALGGLQVVVASTVDEALAVALREAPDVILMDMMMPGKDGLTALSQMRQMPTLAATPVIFMTAKVQQSEVEHYVACGAAGVIAKPFDPMTLAADVKGILGVASQAF